MSISRARRSVSFPFPSSPHWVPTTTVAGTRHLRSLDRITHHCSAPDQGGRRKDPSAIRPPRSPGSVEDDLVVHHLHRHRRALQVAPFEQRQREGVLDLV